MAVKKKTSKKKKVAPRVKFNLKDERLPKIIGVLCLFTALYLSVAFISYFYTWKIDQDKVLEFSWQVLFQGDLTMANWLGRLGALVSNAFFYWGFGLPSIVIIFLLIKLGIALMRRKSLTPFFIASKYSLLVMVFFSLALEFFLRNSTFTWGGAFGESTCYWLTNFVGQVGLFILLIFSLMFFIIWQFNPNIDRLLAISGLPELGKMDFDFFKFVGSTSTSKREPRQKEPKEEDSENEKYIALRPSQNVERAISKPVDSDQKSRMEFEIPESLSSSAKRKPKIDPSTLEMEVNDAVGNSPEGNTVENKPEEEVPFMTVSAAEIAKEHAENASKIEATLNEKNFNEPYDPTLDLSKFEFPDISMLESYDEHKYEIDRDELEANKDQITETLLNSR